MRPLAIALAAVLAACTAPPPAIPSPSPTPEPGYLDVTALLDLSGARGPRGEPLRNALQLWTDLDRARGGGQVKVRLKVVDVGGSEARTLIELRRAAVEDRADAVIVGVTVSFATEAFVEAVRVAALPVVLTLPAPEPASRSGGGAWLFGVAPLPETIAARVVTASVRGILLARDDRPLEPEAAAVLRELERIDPAPLAPALARVGGQDQASVARLAATAGRVHLAGPPREWVPLASALRSGARVQTYVLPWTTDPADLGDLRELELLWPGSASLSATTPTAARAQVLRAYADRHGPPTSVALAAYDALSLVVLAAERVGVDDRDRLREGLEHVSFTGAAASYSFSAARHAGASPDDVVLYRWAGGQAVPAGRR